MPNVTHTVTLQNQTDYASLPHLRQFNTWVNLALAEYVSPVTVSLCIVDTQTMAQLNTQYRNKIGPTNVLAFQLLDEALTLPDTPVLLGDVILCAQIIEQEACEQGKSIEAHFAHLTVHGVLHLLGYDHQTASEADKMESREIVILAQLHFPNPYKE